MKLKVQRLGNVEKGSNDSKRKEMSKLHLRNIHSFGNQLNNLIQLTEQEEIWIKCFIIKTKLHHQGLLLKFTNLSHKIILSYQTLDKDRLNNSNKKLNNLHKISNALQVKKKRLLILKTYQMSKRLRNTTKRCHMLKSYSYKCNKRKRRNSRQKEKLKKKMNWERRRSKMKSRKRRQLINLRKMKVVISWLWEEKFNLVQY